MRYKEFHFRNFKGIVDMTVDLTGDVTTLIGLNESGKTTILEAIFCFSYGAEDLDVINPSMASLRNPEQWIPISRRANFNDEIEISAVVSLSAEDKRAYAAHMKKEVGVSLTTIPDSITIAEKYIFKNSRLGDTKKMWTLPVSGTLRRQTIPRVFKGGSSPEWEAAVTYLKGRLPRIWYFPNFLFELPERFALGEAETSPADDEQDKSRFYRSTFEQILAQLGIGATLETHIVERLHSSERADQRSLNSLLLDMGRVVTTKIFEGWDRIFGRAPTGQEVELVATPGDDPAGAFLELRIKGPDGYYDLSERSLGFRWFFMFLLMTSFRGVAEDGPRSLFLLDEPASNLHSSAQAELLKSFDSLTEQCYLVYTTHSHHLINVRWLDSAYVVKNAALGSLDIADYLTTRMGSRTEITATRYRRFVSENPDQTSYFQPVLDLLDYRPSVLEPVPNVVLVEGKSDFYLLRYVIDILGLETELRLVPGGGAGSLEPLIRLHIGWGKAFLILLDGDTEGTKQQARYESEFGPFITDRCVLLPDVCEDASVKESESLLSTTDRKALLDAVFGSQPRPSSAKKALRQALSELYARGERVDLETASFERFQRLLEALANAVVASQ